MTSGTTSDMPRRSVKPFIAMVVIFALPTLAAWFFYLNPEYLPVSRGNKGELIHPVVPLEQGMLQTIDGSAPFDLQTVAGKWTLVSLQQGPCAQACRKQLADLRQIRLALGDSRFSVARMLISMAPVDAAALEQDFEGLLMARMNTSEMAALFDRLGGETQALNRIYILDPMGNLMMRYASDAPAKDTLKDMERLIKASKNWIKGTQYGHS